MIKSLCESLADELRPLPTRRLVDCLPELATWSKGVWEGIPDSGVEASSSLGYWLYADGSGSSVFARV
jgi:hypothetical protein